MSDAPAAETPVLIVGAGPVGLALAIELGLWGIAATVVDELPAPVPRPKANSTAARTMEHFRRYGCADAIRRAGMPADHPTDVAYFTRYAGHELARLGQPAWGDALARARAGDPRWPTAEPPHRISQMFVEPVLLRRARELGASVQFGWRATALDRAEDHVDVTLAAVADGTPRRVRADWVVGCDGPRSTVRRALGIRYGGEGQVERDFMGGRMLGIHLRAPALYGVMPGRRAWQYWAQNPERRALLITLDGGGDFVLHTQMAPGQDPDAVTDEEARSFVRAAIGAECAFDMLGRWAWNAGFALVAERFGAGRVWLAGDAAHLFTPTGGLGYNTGIDDVANLGWKLAAMIQGWGGAALVASYETERLPIAHRNTEMARRFAESIGRVAIPDTVEDAGPDGTAARAVLGELLARHANLEFEIPGLQLGARYEGSPIVVPDGTPAPPDEPNDYVPTARPGSRAPHAWLDEDCTVALHDYLGPGFFLLLLGGDPRASHPLVRAAERCGVPLGTTAVFDPAVRALYGANLVLIRPDQHVAWRGDAPPADVEALLRRVIGAT